MRICIHILLILVYLLVTTAPGDTDIPFFGFEHGTYLRIKITSSSNDAWIYFDENDQSGKIPLELVVFNPGNHIFMLKKDNLTCCKKEIRIYSNIQSIDFDITDCNLNCCDYEIVKR